MNGVFDAPRPCRCAVGDEGADVETARAVAWAWMSDGRLPGLELDPDARVLRVPPHETDSGNGGYWVRCHLYVDAVDVEAFDVEPVEAFVPRWGLVDWLGLGAVVALLALLLMTL